MYLQLQFKQHRNWIIPKAKQKQQIYIQCIKLQFVVSLTVKYTITKRVCVCLSQKTRGGTHSSREVSSSKYWEKEKM